eukprot:IDg14692t1
MNKKFNWDGTYRQRYIWHLLYLIEFGILQTRDWRKKSEKITPPRTVHDSLCLRDRMEEEDFEMFRKNFRPKTDAEMRMTPSQLSALSYGTKSSRKPQISLQLKSINVKIPIELDASEKAKDINEILQNISRSALPSAPLSGSIANNIASFTEIARRTRGRNARHNL